MLNGLKALFGAILVVMLCVTLRAILDRSVFVAGAALWPDPWFQATLADAYCGFLTFYALVFYREGSWAGRGLWFVLISCSATSYVALRAAPALPPARGRRNRRAAAAAAGVSHALPEVAMPGARNASGTSSGRNAYHRV